MLSNNSTNMKHYHRHWQLLTDNRYRTNGALSRGKLLLNINSLRRQNITSFETDSGASNAHNYSDYNRDMEQAHLNKSAIANSEMLPAISPKTSTMDKKGKTRWQT